MICNHRRKRKILFGLAVMCSLAAIGCSSSSSAGDQRSVKRNKRQAETKKKAPDAPTNAPDTELWLFGPVNQPELTTPLGALGVRTIVDLRAFSVGESKKTLKEYADRDLGIGICLRWRNPGAGESKVMRTDNYDVPPTEKEAEQAISDLISLLQTSDAKRLGDKLFVQFYNEVGGGPGTMIPEDADELFDFATRATAEIRKVNPVLRICGPAITGGQLQPMEKKSRKMEQKAEVIEKAIVWSAEHADVIDMHMHAMDGSWAGVALQSLRDKLDLTARGKTVQILSFEWSCARYPDRENDEGVHNALLSIWDTINEFDLICAAYGPYWPLKNKGNEKVADRFGWVSIVTEDNQRNQPIYDTLVEIGGGDGVGEKQTNRKRRNKGKQRNNGNN